MLCGCGHCGEEDGRKEVILVDIAPGGAEGQAERQRAADEATRHQHAATIMERQQRLMQEAEKQQLEAEQRKQLAANNIENMLVSVEFTEDHVHLEFIPQERLPNGSQRLLPPRRVPVPYIDVESWSYTECTFRLQYLSGEHVNQLRLSTDQACYM